MKRLAIDFGSGVTKIYMPGCGVVLTEATCIAVEEYLDGGERRMRVKAYGDKARQLYGRAAQNTRIVNPVFEGNIVSEELAARLMRHFLEKIEITGRQAKKAEAIFILPCGVNASVREKYARLAASCGFGYTCYTLTPFAATLGHNATISESTPVFSLDIGQSITNIAAFSQDGIISGLSLNLGGGNIDVHIMDELYENQNFKIGSLTAERLKNKVGSLLDDDNKKLVVDGRDTESGAPSSVCINSEQLYGVITTYLDKILEYVTVVISKLPAEVASAVMHGGIYLSGGLAKLDGIVSYIEKKLKIKVNSTEEPQLAAVMGGGAILESDALFDIFADE